MTLLTVLGWTVIHSLWQGAACALCLAIVIGGTRSPRIRYAAACLAMVSLLVISCATFSYLLPTPEAHAVAFRDGRNTASVLYAGRQLEMFQDSGRPSPLPWLGAMWITGALLFQLRTLISWFLAQGLRRRGVCYPPARWQQRLDALAEGLQLSRAVRLLESSLAEVPVVIGHVRPLILVPVGLLANLPVQQVESILLHELAHVRRYDYLVNLLQTAVEGLMFYHPALWWISSVIRAERENCCDDLVVSSSGDAYEYASALAALEVNRGAWREAALAATGGNLLRRVRRLLGQPEGNAHLAPVFSAGLLTISVAAALTAWQVKPPAPAPAMAAPAPAHTIARPAVRPVEIAAQTQATVPAASAYDRWLNEDVVYIISGEERSSFESLQTDDQRVRFIEQFWYRRDPIPATPENEFKKEHYRRISYANERFGAGAIPGWKSDRGRMYITWGPPDEIESHPSGSTYMRPPEQGGGTTVAFPWEKWRYLGIPRPGQESDVEFIDRSRNGEYRMMANRIGNVFLSMTPGVGAYVIVTPERQISPGIPLEFDAPQYLIAFTARTTDGRSRWKSASLVSLCKYAPQEAGCLQQSVYEPGPSAIETGTLEPGEYVLDAFVSDRSGLTTRSYVVKFTVRQ